MERAYIAEVLEHTRGKKTLAAKILGISRKTLLEKRKRYGLD
jgi:DNA-binding NtrC family response regulator